MWSLVMLRRCLISALHRHIVAVCIVTVKDKSDAQVLQATTHISRPSMHTAKHSQGRKTQLCLAVFIDRLELCVVA